MQIGPYTLNNALILAPMAGVTDQPFRQLCRQLGAGLTVSEMTSANPKLWHTRKSQLRRQHSGEPDPISVQIAGGDAEMMAAAAQQNYAEGAQIIDINMGCPAKKVCKKAAGSALLADEELVKKILETTVKAVPIPVTLKIRTGTHPDRRNALTIAQIAEDCGIQALAIHGRTRACGYTGAVEYTTIRQIKKAVSIPIIANGDIDSASKAHYVLEETGADGLMIGRAAQGCPWIFREIQHFLTTGTPLPEPAPEEVHDILIGHLHNLHQFYGELQGVRIARKHIGWYLKGRPNGETWRRAAMSAQTPQAQRTMMDDYFTTLAHHPAEPLRNAA